MSYYVLHGRFRLSPTTVSIRERAGTPAVNKVWFVDVGIQSRGMHGPLRNLLGSIEEQTIQKKKKKCRLSQK